MPDSTFGKSAPKGPSLRHWIRDRVLFLALIIFVSGMGLYIGAGKLFSPEGAWLHPVKEFSLLIAMIGVVSLGYELFLRELTFKEYKQALEEIVNPDAVRLGIKAIFKNRSELGHAYTFEQLFKNVKKEIFIGGSSLLSISTGSRDLLKEKLLAGINVRLLVMDPDSEVVEIITRQIGGKATFLNEINTSLLLFQKLEEELKQVQAPGVGRLEIQTYSVIPSHSFIALDSEEPGGLIVADIGPYLGRSHQRPSMVLIQKKGGLYDHYLELGQALWKESHPVSKTLQARAGEKTRTLVFSSGPKTQVLDTASGQWRPAVLCQLSQRWQGIKGAQWVGFREQVTPQEAQTGGRYRFRLEFDLPVGSPEAIKYADLYVRADDACTLTINGTALKEEVGGAEFPDPFILDVGDYLQPGANEVLFEVVNYAQPQAQAWDDNPLGLIYRLHVEFTE